MIIFSSQNLLLAGAFFGILWLCVLFVLCFLGVHIARLVKFGWLYQKKEEKPAPTQTKPAESKEKTPEHRPSAEPVYYIVERKRKTRQSYGEPKEIRFK